MHGIKSQKPVILLAPHYFGSLRYFEKLYPHLVERFEPVFLLTQFHVRDAALTASHFNFEEMVTYCQDKKYAFEAIYQPQPEGIFKRFPYIQFLRFARIYQEKIKAVLNNASIKKIIAVHDGGFYFNDLFIRAKKRGIDAMVLQWALTYDLQKPVPKPHFFLSMRNSMRGVLLKLACGIRSSNAKTILGMGAASKMGVINQQAKNYFRKCGVPEGKMTVVGYMDFQLAEDLKQKLDIDTKARNEKAASLGIDTSKKNIIICSSAYNSNVVHVLDDKGQLAFYEDIVIALEKVYPKDLYAISLKIHPIENISLYKPLEKYGVRLYDKFVSSPELVYFADLYIADSSTMNFIPIIMGRQCIFVNFLRLPLIEASRTYFGIKKYISDRAEFASLLEDYANSTLTSQYETHPDIFTSDSLKRIIAWVD